MSKGTRPSRRSIAGVSPESKSTMANRAIYAKANAATTRAKVNARRATRQEARRNAGIGR